MGRRRLQRLLQLVNSSQRKTVRVPKRFCGTRCLGWSLRRRNLKRSLSFCRRKSPRQKRSYASAEVRGANRLRGPTIKLPLAARSGQRVVKIEAEKSWVFSDDGG